MTDHIDHTRLAQCTELYKKFIKGHDWLKRQGEDLWRNIGDPLDEIWASLTHEEKERWRKDNPDLMEDVDSEIVEKFSK